MRQIFFVHKQKAPGDEEIAAALGRSRAAWKRLREFLAENYNLNGDWVHYGREFGWVLRYRKGGKALATLSPYKGHFTVEAALGESMHAAIADAHPHHDGRWLFPTVKALKDLDDVTALLLVKREPTKSR